LKAGLGAETRHVSKAPDGLVMHAMLKIGDSPLMLCDARQDWPAKPAHLYLYVPNVDEVYARALQAGAVSINAPRNEFYGDRVAGITDSSGNCWWIATHVEDVSEEELNRRREMLCVPKAKA
jgi:PhnB protein